MENYEKKYKNALEWARQVINGETGFIRKEVEEIFPELAESEDEKIRKEIIAIFKGKIPFTSEEDAKRYIVWLEKQKSVEEIVERCKKSWYNEGKIAGMAEGLSDEEKYQQGWHDALEKQGEKPQGKTALEAVKEEKVDNANKVEPKFKVGDWITDGYLHCKISDVLDDRYIVDTKFTKRSAIPFKRENEYHLWTIEDAKNGDVLASYDIVFIFNKIHNKIHDVWINCHCSTHKDGSFMEEDYDLMTIKYSKEVYPATKEQRDTLMKAMADAGWQFDFEKKELKKSEQKLTKFEDAVKDMMNDYRDAIGDNNVTIEEVKKHSAYLQSLISQNPAWSEEDKNFMHDTISNLTELKDRYGEGYGNVGKCIEWLKSLRPQKQWKPSKEQLNALDSTLQYSQVSHDSYKQLNSLYNDLKKLTK